MWASLIDRSMESERDWGSAARSIKDLAMQLRFFARYAEENGIGPPEVTPGFLRKWCLERVG